MFTVLFVVVGACLSAVVAQQGVPAVCIPNKTDLWLLNDDGDNPCALWAALAHVCDSEVSFVNALTDGQHYGSPSGEENNSCVCNEVSYNLIAGCTYCQNVANTSWLGSLSFMADCSKWSSVLPTNTSKLSIPFWAKQHYLVSWDPNEAFQFAVGGGSTSTTPSSSTTATPSSTSSRSTTPRPTTSTNSPVNGGDDDDFNEVVAASKVGLAAGLAVAIGLPLIFGIIALIVFCVRQKNRKQFYGPLAEYYEQGGRPPPTAHHADGSGVPFAPQFAGAKLPATPTPTSPSIAPIHSIYGAPSGYQVPSQHGYTQSVYSAGEPGANRMSYNPYEPTAMAPSSPPPPFTGAPLNADVGPTSMYSSGAPTVSTVATPPASYAAYGQHMYHPPHPQV